MLTCSLCGGHTFSSTSVLWPSLIAEWGLQPEEVEYVNRQQGKGCSNCGANLRVIALSNAIRNALGSDLLLQEIVEQRWARSLRILDLNGAAAISPVLAQLPRYVRGDYPDVDMHELPYKTSQFDLVIHSDTLEHVPKPVAALKECRRVLRPTGRLCYTVPVIVGRMTRSREGLPKSYHGDPAMPSEDFVVQSEFGADAWTYPLMAGFPSVAINAVEYPAAQAITAWSEGHSAVEIMARLQMLERNFDAMQNSTFWRMTGPIRKAVGATRRILRR
jgi:SAM-dependent methyltransferase